MAFEANSGSLGSVIGGKYSDIWRNYGDIYKYIPKGRMT